MWRLLRFPLLLVFAGLTVGVVWLVSRSIEWERVPLADDAASVEPGPNGSEAASGQGDNGTDEGERPDSPPPPGGQNGRGQITVVWISIDGFKGNYLDRGVTPELSRLRRESLHTYRLRPPFPSLTFPAHVTKATGVPVSGHGIPANRYFDRELGRMMSFPGDAEMLRAEPIWQTAARQGLRVAVHDWPLSHNQTGEHRTAYYHERFDAGLSDQERLDRLLATWRADSDSRPLRLLMGYTKETDTAGHRYGPDAANMLPVIQQLDGELGDFVRRAKSHFDNIRRLDDELYFIFSADHGMLKVQTNINLRMALGPALAAQVQMATGGNIANLYLNSRPANGNQATEDDPSVDAGNPPGETAADPAATGPELPSDANDDPSEDQRQQRVLAQIDAQLAATLPYAQIYRQDNIPPHWGYRDPDRVGDRIVVLPPGYTFNAARQEIESTVEESGGLLGMHGWAVEDVPEMEGLLMIVRYPNPFPQSRDLGAVDMRQLHPTVARLLGIQPADGADAAPLTW